MPDALQTSLEQSFRSTLYALSLLLSFYTSLDSLNATAYMHHPPRQLIEAILEKAKEFDTICADLERSAVHAMTVLQNGASNAAQNNNQIDMSSLFGEEEIEDSNNNNDLMAMFDTSTALDTNLDDPPIDVDSLMQTLEASSASANATDPNDMSSLLGMVDFNSLDPGSNGTMDNSLGDPSALDITSLNPTDLEQLLGSLADT